MRAKIETIRPLLEQECNRLHGHYESWFDALLIGVHCSPSMSNLHVHIMTPDLVSSRLTKKQHYNSFATPFFVPLSKFPVPKDDEIWDLDVRKKYKDQDMKCWRCGLVLKNIPVLKTHLELCWREWLTECGISKKT